MLGTTCCTNTAITWITVDMPVSLGFILVPWSFPGRKVVSVYVLLNIFDSCIGNTDPTSWNLMCWLNRLALSSEGTAPPQHHCCGQLRGTWLGGGDQQGDTDGTDEWPSLHIKPRAQKDGIHRERRVVWWYAFKCFSAWFLEQKAMKRTSVPEEKPTQLRPSLSLFLPQTLPHHQATKLSHGYSWPKPLSLLPDSRPLKRLFSLSLSPSSHNPTSLSSWHKINTTLSGCELWKLSQCLFSAHSCTRCHKSCD